MQLHRYRAHGTEFESEIALPFFASSPAPSVADVTILRGSEDDMQLGGGEELIAEVSEPSDRRMSITFDGHRYRVQFGAVCVVTVDRSGKRLQVWAAPGYEQLEPWLVAGAPMALALSIRGLLALHASTVALGDTSVMLLAASGYGKSTAAGLLCSAGATLVSEDLSVTQRVNDAWVVFPGNRQIRLRRSHNELADVFETHQLDRSSDGRSVVHVATTEKPTVVGRLVVVVLSPDAASVGLTNISSAFGFRSLMSSLRVPGLISAPMLEQQFALVADLVSSVPVAMLTIPWHGQLLSARGIEMRAILEATPS